MDENQLNSEIENFENKNQKIDDRIKEIEDEIPFFRKIAWACIWIGGFLALFGFSSFSIQSCSKPDYWYNGFSLNLLGDYFAGLVSSVWTLGGLFFA